MHGFGTLGDVFFFLVIYGFTIPVALSWLSLFTLLRFAPRFFQVAGIVAHLVSAYWAFALSFSLFVPLGIIATMLLYLSVFHSLYHKLQASRDLYAREVSVFQPNELKR